MEDGTVEVDSSKVAVVLPEPASSLENELKELGSDDVVALLIELVSSEETEELRTEVVSKVEAEEVRPGDVVTVLSDVASSVVEVGSEEAESDDVAEVLSESLASTEEETEELGSDVLAPVVVDSTFSVEETGEELDCVLVGGESEEVGSDDAKVLLEPLCSTEEGAEELGSDVLVTAVLDSISSVDDTGEELESEVVEARAEEV